MGLRKRSAAKVDMLNGSLWDKILRFAVPIACSSILQQLFNAADIAVVGRYSGTDAMAAVGSNSAIIGLIVSLFVGLSVGANVVISNCLGKGDRERAGRAVHTAISVAIICGVLLLLVGEIVARPILRITGVPESVLELAVLYLRIYFIGMPFSMIYNFGAAILRSRGDTQRPMVVLTVSGIVNVILNLFFVCICGMSVEGVAIATVSSQAISAVVLLYLLVKETGELKLNFRELQVDKAILKDMAAIGIPSGLQGCVFSLSNVCIQSAINSLGTVTMAACTAVLNYEMFMVYIINSFSSANVTFTSQNFGAGNYKRCKAVVRTCMGLAAIFMCVLSVVMVVFGRPLTAVFNSDPEVIEIGMVRMKYIMPFQLLNMTIDVMSGGLRGLGKSLVPTIVTLVGICGVRLIWIYTVFRVYHTLSCLVAAYPISWAITTTAILIAYFKVQKKVLHPPMEAAEA